MERLITTIDNLSEKVEKIKLSLTSAEDAKNVKILLDKMAETLKQYNDYADTILKILESGKPLLIGGIKHKSQPRRKRRKSKQKK